MKDRALFPILVLASVAVAILAAIVAPGGWMISVPVIAAILVVMGLRNHSGLQ
ncbi:MAG: hypothetical protein ACJ8C4_13885 [Gemmataceae bacterium]